MTRPCTARRHGTELAYQVDKCRCPAAREAYRIYRKRMAEGRHTPLWVDGTGTARRLRALSAIGWSPTDLGGRLGVDRRTVQQWRAQRSPRVRATTARRIRDLYEQLWDTPSSCTYTRRHAERRGWAVPMAWDDHTIDDPAARPHLGQTPRSRVDDADVIHLTTFGLTRDQIADRLGVTPDSLRDILARRRKAS